MRRKKKMKIFLKVVVALKKVVFLQPISSPGGEIGRHATLRGWCRLRHASSTLVLGAGSTPVRGTAKQVTLIDYQSVRVFLLPFLACRVNHVSTKAFYSLSIPGNGLAKTFGNGVSNSMSFFL